MVKNISGEKYIYLLMAYRLAKLNGGNVKIGEDSGYVGGQNYFRNFTVSNYENKTILTESKNGKNFADYSKYYEVLNENTRVPIIKDYIDESGNNCSKYWRH